jgi:hypothetical protein
MKYDATLRRVVILDNGDVFDMAGIPIRCWRSTTAQTCGWGCAAFRIYECEKDDEGRVGCAALPGGNQRFGFLKDEGDVLVDAGGNTEEGHHGA